MTNGFAWVIGEFALIDKRGNITHQRSVTGYSRIEPINSENQREYLYENAVNHARSKFLYDLHKPSGEDVDFAIIEHGFKRVVEREGGFRTPVETSRDISKKARNRAEQRVLQRADDKREEKTKMTNKQSEEKMYVKKHELTPKQRRDAEDYQLYLAYQQSLKDKKYQQYLREKRN